MAITVVQAANNQTPNTTTQTITISASSVGNLLYICSKRGADSASTLSITDSVGQTGWTQTASGYATQGTDKMGCFYRLNTASGVTSITATWSGGTNATVAGVAYEVSGIGTSSAEDGSINTTTASGTSLASGSIVTTNANDILLYSVGAGVNQITGMNVGSGYTFQSGSNPNTQRDSTQFKIVAAAGSNSTTMTATSSATVLLGIYVAFADRALSTNPAFEDDSFNVIQVQPVDPVISVW